MENIQRDLIERGKIMETKFNDRVGLVVWLYTKKFINKLKRYGLLHYVSKKMNYAIVYVDKNEKEKTKKILEKQHFVRKVETCFNREIAYTFDGVLNKVTELGEEKKRIADENEISLFTQLSERGEN